MPTPTLRTVGTANLLGTALVTALATALATAGTVLGSAHAAAPARPAPEAVVTTIGAAPATAAPGSRFRLAVGVRNKARTPSRPTPVVVRLSRDARATSGDPVVGSARAPRLRPGPSGRVFVPVTVPARAAAASYRLFACTPRRCTPAGAVTVRPTSRPLSGSLTGDLYLTDAGAVTEGPRRTTWEHQARLGVQMTVSGPDSAGGTFTSTGSEWGYSGARTTTESDPDCSEVVDEARTGGGVLREDPDPNRDEIYASFGRLDMSQLSLTAFMRYDKTTTTDVSGDPWRCGTDSVVTGRGLNISSMKLDQVGRTASRITYEVTSVVGEQNVPSDWDQVTGRLVLDLD